MSGSQPGFLNYPADLVHTVHAMPGDGGSYTAITPLWASIPSPSGNTYYDAMNKALGASMTMQPSNGNTYNQILPPLFSGNKLPDWIQIPSFWTAPLNFGQAVEAKLADLTPYLAGDKVKEYPNLAAIFPAGWQAGIWNNKIYGIPEFTTEFQVAGYLYYRADILDKLGIGTPQIKSINDLYDLGKEINDPKAKRWAFDDVWTGLLQPFSMPPNPPAWTTNSQGDLLAAWETENIIEAMMWEAKLVKAGLMNPDAIALNTNSAKQRFWSGQQLIMFDGQGAWGWQRPDLGQPPRTRVTCGWRSPFFTASGSGTPRIALGARQPVVQLPEQEPVQEPDHRAAADRQLPGRPVRHVRVHAGQLRHPGHRLHDDQDRPGADGDRQQAGGHDLLVPGRAEPADQQPRLSHRDPGHGASSSSGTPGTATSRCSTA